MMGGKDTGPAIEELAALPLEKRYVWRVASALRWAFVSTLFGQKQMELMMLSAIKNTRAMVAESEHGESPAG